MNRRRIALLLPRLGRYGGVEQFAWHLAEALAQRGHEVDFICARKEGEAPAGVRPVVVGRKGGLKVLKALHYLVQAERMRRRGDYDLTVSFGKTWEQDILRVGGGPLSTFWQLSGEAWPKGPRRTLKCLTRHLSPYNWLTHIIERRQYDGHCKIICVSDAVRGWTLQAFPSLAATPPEVIYNRPQLERFTPAPDTGRAACRERFSIPAGHVAIGTASSNFILKGVGHLIHALSLLPPHFMLLVAGGRNPGPFMDVARKLGVSDRVRFLGRVDDMPAFYNAIDVFALNTFYDACSNAVLEALACGTPALSTTRNGSSRFLPEAWVTDAPDDPADLAARLAALASEERTEGFAWPEDVKAGIPAWVERIEREMESGIRRG
ncbi:glycosyltransferase family 4 protein [Nitratidesulfovibrio vulgaris]|uniref:Glycosyl transferase, group 1 family protein n=1 Tax=Nitratidesulfovibrio vulgaris (strain ATCC 29579 / DSM 644 / CCUG 34227 / NCIMB 8303 / VKM B-1760 / Hildenborough) TaxID=882 RepID=Q728G8_NITV2|nr:glycosyltransferase family 4 protein [Nitratidesulfovibrio vulgaris]AAS97107.1 glycosyl transferase, group 1 family protein [Nitratidesulfovibrio vulgaris str. Hildenborough]ADP87576.1 glycosyl transferase group 1 [Nitratidesulfovibrio vulgaris RCH1]WCB47403.1 glycosyltransferase family 4 protein [Nitratidesulfovibrio vulgaris]